MSAHYASGIRTRVRTAIAPMHAEPRVSSPQVSQQLAGYFVDILSREGDWCRARGEDGYEGWIHRGFLVDLPPSTARQSYQVPRVSLGCVARASSGARRALPLRALLAPEEMLQWGEAIELTQLPARFPADADAVLRTAQEFFEGTSYQWGGVTPWGADCSGLVQSAFALHGVVLPRDAWQQAELGRPGAAKLEEAGAAELLFFSDRDDRKITHVGIAAGECRMVHLALGRGGFAVERLDDTHDAYMTALASRFVCARRVL